MSREAQLLIAAVRLVNWGIRLGGNSGAWSPGMRCIRSRIFQDTVAQFPLKNLFLTSINHDTEYLLFSCRTVQYYQLRRAQLSI
jgi:hypothetical protein